MAQELKVELWKSNPEWFRPWFDSEAYQLLYGHRSQEEANFLIGNLSAAGVLGDEGRILDAGCGTGRHARALAEGGFSVLGFDLSEQSIRQAINLNKHATNPEYVREDIRNIHMKAEWEGQFDVVTNFFTSLGYFQTPKEQLQVVRGLGSTLKKGGALIVDYLNVPFVESSMKTYERVERGGIEFEIHRRIEAGWIEKSIQFHWEGTRHHHVERVQALGRTEFENLLASCGMTIVHVWGNYSLDSWSRNSPRFMFQAIKH